VAYLQMAVADAEFRVCKPRGHICMHLSRSTPTVGEISSLLTDHNHDSKDDIKNDDIKTINGKMYIILVTSCVSQAGFTDESKHHKNDCVAGRTKSHSDRRVHDSKQQKFGSP
jgi:hypothetical protein